MFNRLTAALALLAALFAAAPAQAHDPFDGSSELRVLDDRIEARVTLGYDAARAVLAALELAPEQASAITAGDVPASLPAARAAMLVRLYAGNQPVAPMSFAGAAGRDEITFLVSFPRPAGEVSVRAAYVELVDDMRPGTLVVLDAGRRVLASTLVSRAAPGAVVPLAAPAATTAQADGFGAFFLLGVEHILTGFDHLLFLCALLITLTRIGPMLGVVTAFTLAHSLTLALAALDVAALPPSVVEPLIALSIIVACVDNLVRREAARERLWMAAGFGLIHGFGFAGLLRESMRANAGQGLLLPLLGFNLGVEAGQLVVAAMLIALLVLLRRRESFVRYGAPAASCLVIAISTWWLLERTAIV